MTTRIWLPLGSHFSRDIRPGGQATAKAAFSPLKHRKRSHGAAGLPCQCWDGSQKEIFAALSSLRKTCHKELSQVAFAPFTSFSRCVFLLLFSRSRMETASSAALRYRRNKQTGLARAFSRGAYCVNKTVRMLS